MATTSAPIPYPLLARHRRIHIFDQPRTFVFETRSGMHLALAGFPYDRAGVRQNFRGLLDETGWREPRADVRLLCLHQIVEGAVVGPVGYTFRDAPDVIRGRDIRGGLAAVLSGHIHRFQVLTHDLARRPLAAPVLYPGSIERTSFAERDEPKGYLLLEVSGSEDGGTMTHWHFDELPARPMLELPLDVGGLGAVALELALQAMIARADPDAILRIRVDGELDTDAAPALRAATLRGLAPETMNISVTLSKETRALQAAAAVEQNGELNQ